MDGERRGKKVGALNAPGWSVVLGLFRRLADRFAEANQEQQLWMSGLRIERAPHLEVREVERSGAEHERRR